MYREANPAADELTKDAHGLTDMESWAEKFSDITHSDGRRIGGF